MADEARPAVAPNSLQSVVILDLPTRPNSNPIAAGAVSCTTTRLPWEDDHVDDGEDDEEDKNARPHHQQELRKSPSISSQISARLARLSSTARSSTAELVGKTRTFSRSTTFAVGFSLLAVGGLVVGFVFLTFALSKDGGNDRLKTTTIAVDNSAQQELILNADDLLNFDNFLGVENNYNATLTSSGGSSAQPGTAADTDTSGNTWTDVVSDATSTGLIVWTDDMINVTTTNASSTNSTSAMNDTNDTTSTGAVPSNASSTIFAQTIIQTAQQLLIDKMWKESLFCPRLLPCCANQFRNSQITKVTNVLYGTGRNLVDNDQKSYPLKLDLYLPPDVLELASPPTPPSSTNGAPTTPQRQPPRPAVLFLHGGAWLPEAAQRNSSKSSNEARKHARGWAKRGFVGVSVEYRRWNSLTTEWKSRILSDPVRDVWTSIRFLKQNAAAYNIDASKIGLVGSAAGAHNAGHAGFFEELKLGLGTTGNVAGAGTTSSNPNAIPFENDEHLAQATSPINFVIQQSGALAGWAPLFPPDQYWKQSVSLLPSYLLIMSRNDTLADYTKGIDTMRYLREKFPTSHNPPNPLLRNTEQFRRFLVLPGRDHELDAFQKKGRFNSQLFNDEVGFVIRAMDVQSCGLQDLQTLAAAAVV
ncbi:unnamed protein product [Amoebophrya sp. A120]|nr:unnamed protein product [Amoebophrya sp. A120]|eukprot:GSA120T00008057001.1